MNRTAQYFCAAIVIAFTTVCTTPPAIASEADAPAKPAEAAATESTSATAPVTRSIAVTIVNNSEREMHAKLFARGSNQQWPSIGRAYVVPPAGQSHVFKIECQEGEQICYGAWVDRARRRHEFGSGARGLISCERCCRVCEANAKDMKFVIRRN